MNIESLQSFIAVAEYQSFSQAARQIYVSQPTISRQVRALEKELGITLFERGNSTMSLTDVGQHCFDLAKAAVKSWEEMQSLAVQQNGVVAGRFVVGYANTRAGESVLAALREMSRLYPDLDIRTSCTRASMSLQALRCKDIDLAITSQQSVMHHTDIEYYVLCPSGLMIVVPSNHALAGRDCVTLDDIRKETIIIKTRASFPEEYDAFFEELKMQGVALDSIMEEKTTPDVFLQIQLGHGIGCMGGGLLSHRIEGLCAVPLISTKQEHSLVAAWRKGDDKLVTRTFIDLFTQLPNEPVMSKPSVV